ncbi:MAG: hydroxymethylglutaryl-CoA lyase [Rhodospirillales bacterium]|jgi:hydroxymethylglutaryl-CoA lyase
MRLPANVRLVDVGPRDGLQNEAEPFGIEDRVTLIDHLSAAGLPSIEVGSFVSPKWVPQMAGTDLVLANIIQRSGTAYPVLTPNLQGFEAALAAGAREVAIFAAASETFWQKNTNCGIAESLERFRPLCAKASERNIRVRGYVSCVLGCPYEGAIDPARVADVAEQLFKMGCYEISLGDTIGTGTPGRAQAVVAETAKRLPLAQLAAHFHDTYGQALANLLAVMEMGISTIDCSIAGLGGCPYAKGASGNVATEDVLYMLNGLDIKTGVEMELLLVASRFVSQRLGRPPASKVARALSCG